MGIIELAPRTLCRTCTGCSLLELKEFRGKYLCIAYRQSEPQYKVKNWVDQKDDNEDDDNNVSINISNNAVKENYDNIPVADMQRSYQYYFFQDCEGAVRLFRSRYLIPFNCESSTE